jgi:hypothetical protein
MGAVPTTAKTGLPAWGRRYTVFVILTLVNLAVWLDEGVFGALTPYWSKALHLTPTQGPTTRPGAEPQGDDRS